jgi:acetylornithine deacetylase/succinyl-diaminopimelate desuccinylase-like protein
LDLQNTSDKALLDTLRELIAIPSVSADKRLSDECFRGAKFIAKQLETLGAEVKMTQVMEGKNPVVIGRLGHNPAVPTVTFYGHYDVQPALEEGWKTNPFQMTSIDGYLYGRGTSDNKVCLRHTVSPWTLGKADAAQATVVAVSDRY